MHPHNIKLLLLLPYVLMFSLSIFSQEKYEKEVRLKKENVPPIALSFVDSFCGVKKVKWYTEFGINDTSIEAKLKFMDRKYSIEFTSRGALEDVEVEIDAKEIPKEAFTEINHYILNKHGKYKISKVQIQYAKNQPIDLSFLSNKTLENPIEINFELNINTRVEKTYKAFEYLFSWEGKFCQRVEIIGKNTDNIEY